jgi:O-methyltransferase
MRNAQIGGVGRLLRKPWYLWWKWVEKCAYSGREYCLSIPFGHRVYTPWFSSDSTFARLYENVGGDSVSVDRCYIIYSLCQRSLSIQGDVAECGVYAGGTAHLFAETISRQSPSRYQQLHLFDTFAGMPEDVSPETDYHSPGDFGDTSLAQVANRLKIYPFVRFYPGLIPHTFTEIRSVQPFSFVHIDVDIFSATLASCEFFWPRLSPGGAMVFDDYGFHPYRFAERSAVDQFFQNTVEKPIVLPTGQAIVLKLP